MNNKIIQMKRKWVIPKLNILIPMAGLGSSFRKAGYELPKPLIDVNKKPMIQVAVENLNIDAHYIYVVQKEHLKEYGLVELLGSVTPNFTIIETDGLTEGAACTALLARKIINNNSPLFFANSDQYVEWHPRKFLKQMYATEVDGGIVTFKSSDPHFSFVKLDENGLVERVAEKNPISDIATVGFYYWKQGSDFVKYAEQMISKEIRVNNEFYVCPVYNEAIDDGKNIGIHNAKAYWNLGTPDDLKTFLKFQKSKKRFFLFSNKKKNKQAELHVHHL